MTPAYFSVRAIFSVDIGAHHASSDSDDRSNFKARIFVVFPVHVCLPAFGTLYTEKRYSIGN